MQTNKLISLAVVFLLVINIVLLLKVDDLKDELNSLSQNYQHLQSNVNAVAGNVNQSLDRFTREQSWITPIDIDYAKSKAAAGNDLVIVTWQIKDYPEDSRIFFNYSKADTEEFKTIPVQDKGNGLFEVGLPLDIKIEPVCDISVIRSGEQRGEQRAVLREEKVEPADQGLKAYVSMKSNGILKSSEISYLNLSHLAQVQYNPLTGFLEINNKKYDISLYEHNNGGNPLKSLSVKFYNGDSLVTDKTVDARILPDGSKNFILTYDAGSETISGIVFDVKYLDGESFTKEIL